MTEKKNKILFLILAIGLLIILLYGLTQIFEKHSKPEITVDNLMDRGKSMNEKNSPDYSAFDTPQVLAFLFHPRPDHSSPPGNAVEMSIPVDDDVTIGANIFTADKKAPTILFFHGNGEIVSDYNDLGPIYNKLGINFFPVDYRGYGKSTGSPTVSAMMKDCHVIFKFAKNWLNDNGYTGPFIIMGRSLGSASVLELAANYEESVDALIVESGFAYALPLLKLLGINTNALGLKEDGFSNSEKIKKFKKPTLVIHAEFDHIIPFSDGQALYEACPASDKTFLKIPDANHNTIFAYGINEYMNAVKTIVDSLSNKRD